MTEPVTNAFRQMDAMYRYQRHVYDASRKFYLLGRDRLLDGIKASSGETVAEIGCGTCRNIEILARRYPDARFFGIDASAEMLLTGRGKIARAGLKNVELRVGLADEFDRRQSFGIDESFDKIFFSYSISMIARWRESIARAVANLKPGGKMYILDFYDQRDLPAWFGSLLWAWLRKFGVQFWTDLIPYLTQLDREGVGRLTLSTVAHGYAFLAEFQKAS